ncbi:MAG: glutaredoxin family protein [Candidatus Helarchaeota archaeon]
MEITLYTKDGCERCEALKKFLQAHQLTYFEKDIDTQEVVQELVADEYVLQTYCDEDSCIVITPIVKIDGKWVADEFFTDEGINEQLTKNIFAIQ